MGLIQQVVVSNSLIKRLWMPEICTVPTGDQEKYPEIFWGLSNYYKLRKFPQHFWKLGELGKGINTGYLILTLP